MISVSEPHREHRLPKKLFLSFYKLTFICVAVLHEAHLNNELLIKTALVSEEVHTLTWVNWHVCLNIVLMLLFVCGAHRLTIFQE